MTDVLLILLVLLPFAGSAVAAFLPVNARNAESWLAGLVALACLGAVLLAWPMVRAGDVLHLRWAWLPAAGLEFHLRMDGFAWLMCVLVTGIGALVVLYARYYLSPQDPVPRFFAFLLAFMGAMLGIVMSGNLVQLVFFWELTSLVSFLLIGYWHHSQAARDGARMALVITASGGLALLAGVLLLGHITGSYELDQVLVSGDLVRAHPLYLAALVLVLLGALTKSAQFPFHFWLPQAMAAPTPVSAYLHSATMVKAGVFLMARLWPVLAGTDAWFWIVGGCGLATLLIGGAIAMFQQDLKGLLAYSTISNLGLITFLLGLNSPLAAVAALFHIVNHAIFKASLFMAAGIIDHETGTRDIRRLSGLYRLMPWTATLAMVAAASMAGVPLANGFISKEMFFHESIAASTPWPLLGELLPWLAMTAAAFSVAYSLRFIHGAFFGPPPMDLPQPAKEPPRWMRLPVELLVLACLLLGVMPGVVAGPALAAAVRSVLGSGVPAYSLALWHGFTWPLLMSAVATLAGVLVYRRLYHYLERQPDGPRVLRRPAGKRIFERVLVTVSWRWARWAEAHLTSRRLQPQLRLLVAIALAAACWPMLQAVLAMPAPRVQALDPVLGLTWVLGIACAVGAAWQARYHRLAALILMGGAGLAVVITFVRLSAPDLALTQLLVEVVTTVLILLGLRWLPKRLELEPVTVRTAVRRAVDVALATAAGAGAALGAWLVMVSPPVDGISGFFVRHALSEGGGHNVVNVILVDFRAFDTLGEISVLGIVALSVYALLRRFRPAPDSVGVPEQQRALDALDDPARIASRSGEPPDYLAVPAVLMRQLLPFMSLVAAFLLLRGHDLPGGGFVAGLAMATALIVQYMAGGVRWVESQLRIHPVRWIAAGLGAALATGMGALLAGHPFLTSSSPHVELPLLGTLPLPSAFAFDIGVFLLVVGATTLVLVALAHQSLRGPRSPAQEAAWRR